MRCNADLMQKKEDMTAEAQKLTAYAELFLERCSLNLATPSVIH